MPWSTIANNQTISRANLQDAINNGLFTLKAAFPADNKQITKANADAYINIPIQTWLPLAVKASNQLVTKNDLQTLSTSGGLFIIDAAYGINVTSLTGSVGSLPTGISYPVNSGTIASVDYITTIPTQTITVNLDGSLNFYPSNMTLYIDSVAIETKPIYNIPTTLTFSFPSTSGPSEVKFVISQNVTPPPSSFKFQSTDVNHVLVSKSTGQYMLVAGGGYELSGSGYKQYFAPTQGYLYVSSNGNTGGTPTFTSTGLRGFWTSLSASDSGQYMLATQGPGYCYVSSNYGASWTQVSSLGPKTFLGGCVFNNGYMIVITSTADVSKTYRSTDAGSSWAEILLQGGSSTMLLNSITCAPATGWAMISAYSGGFFTSNTYGATFSKLNNAVVGDNVNPSFSELKYSPDANVLLMIRADDGPPRTTSLMYSLNYGVTLNPIPGSTRTAPQGWIGLGVSNNGSYNWAASTNQYPQRITNFSSVSSITSFSNNYLTCCDQTNGGSIILFGSSGSQSGYGLYRSTNGGTSFQPL